MNKDHPDAVATTWSLNFEQVEQQSPIAADLLRFLAFLAPETIPEELLVRGANEPGEQLEPIAADETRLEEWSHPGSDTDIEGTVSAMLCSIKQPRKREAGKTLYRKLRYIANMTKEIKCRANNENDLWRVAPLSFLRQVQAFLGN